MSPNLARVERDALARSAESYQRALGGHLNTLAWACKGDVAGAWWLAHGCSIHLEGYFLVRAR